MLRSFTLFCLLATVCLAQTGAGAIQGVVKDSTGAVMAAAKVSIVHETTTRKYETASNDVGFYIFPSVQTGDYKISVTAPGMRPWEGSVLLRVGQTATIDPVLTVGATTTEVTVVGDVTPLVTTESPTVGNVVERARVEQLPLNGRLLQYMIQSTTPGVDGNPSNPTVYGIRFGMEFVQDGAVLANRTYGGISSRPPGMDTVEEFRVETSASSSKFSAPATTILSTRGGTNAFHGSLFETMRNNGFGVARARQDFYDKPPQLIRNEFGASAGGPVVLPRIYNGKNRTFFFFGWEAYRHAYSATAVTSMHTMAMRQGDFSGLVDGAGRSYTLYDPWTTDSRTWQRQPYPNNQIPINRESPMAKYLLGVTPVPSHPNVNPLVAPNYYGLVPLSNRNHTETIRVDHRLTDRDQVFGRYSHGSVLNNGLRSVLPTTDGLLNTNRFPSRDDGAVLSWTHTFSPAFFSETLLSGSEDELIVGKGSADAGFLINKLGVPDPYNNPYGAIVVRVVGFGMDYREQEMEIGRNRIILADQNFTKVSGRHQFQFGGRYRHERLHVLGGQPRLTNNFANSSYGTALYDPRSGAAHAPAPFTGHNAAGFFIGYAAGYDTLLIRGWYHMTSRTVVGYFQDNFKATPRLTLNYGVRWEFFPPFKEDSNLLTGFDFQKKAVITGTPLDQLYSTGATAPEVVQDYIDIGVKFLSTKEAGLPDSLIYANPWDFNPRAGFAYQLGQGKRATVLRGGYGLYGFAPDLRSFTDNMRRNIPTYSTRRSDLTAAQYTPDGLPNWNLRNPPAVIAGVNSKDVLVQRQQGAALRGSFRVTSFEPHQSTMRAHEWNFTLEREVWQDTVVRAGYVGTHALRLEQYQDFNMPPTNYVWFVRTGQPLPTGEYAGTAMGPFDQTTYGELRYYRRTGWSNANVFRLEAERRYARGVGFQFFYVLSNALKSKSSNKDFDYVYPVENYLPNAVPTDYMARNRFLNYRRDDDIPKHRLNWNWIVDLPFGRGHKFLGNAGGFLDRVVGGWQIAGLGQFRSQYFALPTSYFGPTGTVEVYGKKYPIEDCRSGVCYQGYLWYNGYIPANRINSYAANGKPNGVMGVPAEYRPATQPVFATPKEGGSAADPNRPYYETNTTWVQLKSGVLQRTTLDSNLHPFRNQFVPGPWNFALDASAFKTVRITERVFVRFNADLFNVLNNPGLVQPGADGIVTRRLSANTPRQLQLTLRLTW
ncbi:MAG: carboxypeptidase-like regulatory domain-containing protein [Acidobacteriota bacterium]